jgi:hypothetical protein
MRVEFILQLSSPFSAVAGDARRESRPKGEFLLDERLPRRQATTESATHSIDVCRPGVTAMLATFHGLTSCY